MGRIMFAAIVIITMTKMATSNSISYKIDIDWNMIFIHIIVVSEADLYILMLYVS